LNVARARACDKTGRIRPGETGSGQQIRRRDIGLCGNSQLSGLDIQRARISRLQVRLGAIERTLQGIQVNLPAEVLLRGFPDRPEILLGVMGLVDKTDRGWRGSSGKRGGTADEEKRGRQAGDGGWGWKTSHSNDKSAVSGPPSMHAGEPSKPATRMKWQCRGFAIAAGLRRTQGAPASVDALRGRMLG